MQLTANATRADNSVENVSPQAVWMSQDPRVVEMSTTGAAKGIGRGEAVIRTYYGGWSASTRTFVLPEGTYRLDGRVTDSGMGVAGVTVTVMGSVGGDLTTITDDEGRYWLYGVRDRVRLLAKGAGYRDRIEDVDVVGHRSFDFQITAERERADLRGLYRLTLHRAPCPDTPVPDTRSYDATVTQDGPRLTVALSGADFIVSRGRGNAFSGFIDAGNRVTFAIGDPSDEYHYGPYDFVERIDDARALIVNGPVTAELSSTGISGTLRGAFLLSASVEPFVRIHALLWHGAPVRDGSTVVVVMRRYNVGLKGVVRTHIVALVVVSTAGVGGFSWRKMQATASAARHGHHYPRHHPCRPPPGIWLHGRGDAPSRSAGARGGRFRSGDLRRAADVAGALQPVHGTVPTAPRRSGQCRSAAVAATHDARGDRARAQGSAPERSSDRSCSMRTAVSHRASIRTGALSMPADLGERMGHRGGGPGMKL